MLPIKTSTPRPYWSVFDRLRKTRNIRPSSMIDTSHHARWVAELKADGVGMVNSPARKKPKKHVVAAAQSNASS